MTASRTLPGPAATAAGPGPAWRRRRTITCTRCHRDRPHAGRGICTSCHRGTQPRIADAPTGTGPGGAGVRRAPDAVAGRREDYFFLRDQGATRAEAARRVGISYRTALRYEEAARVA